MMKSSPAGTFNEMKKSCTDCHTTRTPLWRGGPAGPRSLCNACGIRYRKTKKRALLGRDKGRAQKRKRKYSSNSNNHQGRINGCCRKRYGRGRTSGHTSDVSILRLSLCLISFSSFLFSIYQPQLPHHHSFFYLFAIDGMDGVNATFDALG